MDDEGAMNQNDRALECYNLGTLNEFGTSLVRGTPMGIEICLDSGFQLVYKYVHVHIHIHIISPNNRRPRIFH